MSYRQSPLRPRGRRRRGPAPGVVLLLVILLAAGGGAAYYFHSHATKHTPGPAAPGSASASASIPPSPANNLVQSFAAAWSKGDLSTVPFAVGLTGAEVQNQYAAIVKGLQARSVHIDASAVAHTADDNVSRSELTVTWQLPGDQVWSYASKVDVRAADGNWGVVWQPSSIEPSLAAGDALQYTRLAPKRATILDGTGQPIIIDRSVTDIGVEAGQAGNPVTTANQLATILGVAADTIATRIKAAKSDEFVDVITLREADYEKVSAALATVPGIVLRDQTLALSPSHDFARSLLGTVGPVTKEIVDASKGRYVAGDTTGLGGLEQEFDSTIGGTPGFEIDVVHPASQIGTKVPTVLKVQPAVDGKSLQTTLDVRVEAAADAALQTRVRVVEVVLGVAAGGLGGGDQAVLRHHRQVGARGRLRDLPAHVGGARLRDAAVVLGVTGVGPGGRRHERDGQRQVRRQLARRQLDDGRHARHAIVIEAGVAGVAVQRREPTGPRLVDERVRTVDLGDGDRHGRVAIERAGHRLLQGDPLGRRRGRRGGVAFGRPGHARPGEGGRADQRTDERHAAHEDG